MQKQQIAADSGNRAGDLEAQGEISDLMARVDELYRHFHANRGLAGVALRWRMICSPVPQPPTLLVPDCDIFYLIPVYTLPRRPRGSLFSKSARMRIHRHRSQRTPRRPQRKS
jgi:hypothetical protein